MEDLKKLVVAIVGAYIITVYLLPFLLNMTGLIYVVYVTSYIGITLQFIQIIVGVFSFFVLFTRIPLFYFWKFR